MRLEIGPRDGIGWFLTKNLQRLVGDKAALDAPDASAHQIVDALDRLIEGPCRDQAQQPRQLDLVPRHMRLDIGDAEDGEAGGRRLGIPHRLYCGDFHLLVECRGVTAFITEYDDGQRGSEAEARGDRHRPPGEWHMTAAQQIESANRQHENRTGDIARAHGVHELGLSRRVEHQFVE